MRYFLLSLIFHISIVIFTFETIKDELEFKQVGNPKISFTMLGTSEKTSGSSQDFIFKKQASQQKKTKAKKKIKKVIKQKKKAVKKHTDKKKQKAMKKIEKIKKIQEKEIISEPNNIQEKNDKVPLNPTIERTTQQKDQNFQKNEIRTGFIKLADGSIAAKNQGVKGLSYGFLRQPEPKYPEIAKKMGFNKDITIKVRFLIGYNGHIEEIKFYDDIEKFGFHNEVKKALNQWRSTPITVNGNKVKLYFYKKFKFEKN